MALPCGGADAGGRARLGCRGREGFAVGSDQEKDADRGEEHPSIRGHEEPGTGGRPLVGLRHFQVRMDCRLSLRERRPFHGAKGDKRSHYPTTSSVAGRAGCGSALN